MSVLMRQEFPVWESFMGFQQVKEPELTTTDVHLICSDGVIPVHAFVLQAVSPFFDKMLASQVNPNITYVHIIYIKSHT